MHRTDSPRPLVLPVVLSGIFLVVLDFFIVNVAMPSLQLSLHAGPTAIQWMVAGYGLAFAAGLVVCGRLGDLYGRRRLFVIGLALFTAASGACGLAPSAGALVAARVLQGLAASLLAPQVLSLLNVLYEGEARARAFAAYGLAMGFAGVGGQLIGGALIEADLAGLDWRSCFLINLPVGAVALALAPRLIPESREPRGGGLDLPGAALVTAGLVAVVLPLVEGRALHWPAWTFAALAASVALLLVFWRRARSLEARGGAPLVAPSLLRERAFAIGLVVVLAFYAGMASFFLVLALYLQDGLGLSPLRSGAIFSVLGAGYFAGTIAGPALAARLGRQALALGALVLAAGLVVLERTSRELGTGGHPLWLAPGLLVDGLGMGAVMAPLVATVLAGTSARHAGAAAGLLSAAQQVGNAIGVALIGIVFYGALGEPPVPADFPHAFGAGLGLLIAMALAVVGLVQLLPGPRARGREAGEPVPQGA